MYNNKLLLFNEEEKESEHKIENIIWSDNKFPRV